MRRSFRFAIALILTLVGLANRLALGAEPPGYPDKPPFGANEQLPAPKGVLSAQPYRSGYGRTGERVVPRDLPAANIVIVLLPGTTLSDWLGAGAPNLQGLMNTGAIAVMNTRTARMPSDKLREPPAAAVLTLAAGARAAIAAGATDFVPANAPSSYGPCAGELYARRMGQTVPPVDGLGPTPLAQPLSPPGKEEPDDYWVDADWARLLSANQGIGYQIRLGNLADALRAAGLSMVAIGSPSYPTPLPSRERGIGTGGDAGWAVLLAAKHDGIADVTDHWPTAAELSAGGCWVIDLGGDVPAADASIGELASAVRQSHGRMIVVSPFVNDRAYSQEDRLAPILIWGSGIAPGLLYSDSTRREGLITNVDVAPTVAAYCGATLPVLPFGRPLTVAQAARPFSVLRDIQWSAESQRIGQRALPYCAIAIGICLLVLCASVVRSGRAGICATIPVVVILALALADSSLSFAVILAALLLMAGAVARKRPVQTVIAWITTYLAAILLVDAVRGGSLMQRSLLGYSPIEGARYYGMGNEAMGALAGALLVATAYFWPRINLPPSSLKGRGSGRSDWRRWVLSAIMAAAIVIVGWPSSGAKAGGVIVLAGACAIFLSTVHGRRLGWREWVGAGVFGIVLLAGIALLDASRSTGAQSHLGGAIARIAHGGPSQALDIVVRKLAVGLKLAVHSAWALPVWCGFLCLALQRRAAAAGEASEKALLDAGLAAAVICLLFNDAGAVACALCLAIVCGYSSCSRINPGRQRFRIEASTVSS
jgi:hypothetical protein